MGGKNGRLQLKSSSNSILYQTEPNPLTDFSDRLRLEVTFDNFVQFAYFSGTAMKFYRLPDVFGITTT